MHQVLAHNLSIFATGVILYELLMGESLKTFLGSLTPPLVENQVGLPNQHAFVTYLHTFCGMGDTSNCKLYEHLTIAEVPLPAQKLLLRMLLESSKSSEQPPTAQEYLDSDEMKAW